MRQTDTIMKETYTIRPIEDQDIPDVIQVLCEGFPNNNAEFYKAVFRRLRERDHPAETQRYGYVIDDKGVQGVMLTSGSLHGPWNTPLVFINLSNWTVRPHYRGEAAKLLYGEACGDNTVTTTNLSPVWYTLNTVEKYGFKPFCSGQMLGIGTTRSKGRLLTIEEAEKAELDTRQVQLLKDHSRMNCLCICLESSEALAPLIFIKRTIKKLIPVAQLIYCESLDVFSENSLTINHWLLKHGCPFMLVDASGQVQGMLGKYFHGLGAKYFLGPAPILNIDHTYSEMVYIGF